MRHNTSPDVTKVAYLDTDGIAWLDAAGPWSESAGWATVGAGVVLAPSEKVRLMTVELPLSSQRQRRAALPFAVEEYLAEPLSHVHVAFGAEVAHRRYLSGVVGHESMGGWIEALNGAGLARCRIVPDALTVPRPPEGAWSVWVVGPRALVRRADGAGFALGVAVLADAWKLAGEPVLIHHGGELPAGLTAQEAQGGHDADIAATSFDLRQGVYARTEQGRRGALKVAALLVALGLVGHAAVAAIDTLALKRLAEDRRNEARALLQEMAPDLPANGDMLAQFSRFQPSGTEPQGRFLPLLSRVSETLQPLAEGLAVQALAFSATDNTLSLDLQASDLAALQRIEAALSEAGLEATSGVATAGGGGAEARIVISDTTGGY